MDKTTKRNLLEVDIVQRDRDYSAQRANLVCQRFAAGLHETLVKLPQVPTVYINLVHSQLTRAVRTLSSPEAFMEPEAAQAQGLISPQEAAQALAFRTALGKTRKALGTSSETIEALRDVFPPDAQPQWDRAELLAACELLMAHPATRLDDHRRAELRAQHLDGLTPRPETPRQGPRL